MKPPSLRERIEKIFNERTISPEEQTNRVLLAVKEAMPEKKKDEFFSDVRGWNECREEMEKRCE